MGKALQCQIITIINTSFRWRSQSVDCFQINTKVLLWHNITKESSDLVSCSPPHESQSPYAITGWLTAATSRERLIGTWRAPVVVWNHALRTAWRSIFELDLNLTCFSQNSTTFFQLLNTKPHDGLAEAMQPPSPRPFTRSCLLEIPYQQRDVTYNRNVVLFISCTHPPKIILSTPSAQQTAHIRYGKTDLFATDCNEIDSH